jgi:acetyl esterase
MASPPASSGKLRKAAIFVVVVALLLYRLLNHDWTIVRLFCSPWSSIAADEELLNASKEWYSWQGRAFSASGATTIDVEIPTRGGDVIPARFHVPLGLRASKRIPIAIYYHGGGWVWGDVDSSASAATKLAVESGMIVLNVGYRKAPEYQFPVAVQDAQSALRFARKHGSQYGADTNKIALVGDSAGGNLAFAVALAQPLLSGLLQPPLCALVGVSPVFSYAHWEKAEGSYEQYYTGYLLTHKLMGMFWHLYCKDIEGCSKWLASPLEAPAWRLRRLRRTPVFLQAASHEILLDEVVEMNGRLLEEAYVDSSLTIYNGTVHGFFAKPMPSGRASLVDAAAFLSQNCVSS